MRAAFCEIHALLAAVPPIGYARGLQSENFAGDEEPANVDELTNTEVVDKMTGRVRYAGIPIEVEPVAAQDSIRH